MLNAKSNRVKILIVKEGNWGVTPNPAALQFIRFTGESLSESANSTESDEITGDRGVEDVMVLSRSAAGGIDTECLYGVHDDLIANLLCGAWVVDTPVAGTDRVQSGVLEESYTIEKRLTDVGQFFTYRGAKVASMTDEIAAEKKVSRKFSFMAKSEERANATVGTDPDVPAAATKPMTASRNLTEFNINGAALVNTFLDSYTMTVESSLRAQKAAGQDGLVGVAAGSEKVKGSIVLYFVDGTLYDDYKAENEISIDYTLTDPDGNKVKTDLPRVKLLNPKILAEGKDGDVMAKFDFQALRDPSGYTIGFERTPAV